MRAVTIVDSRNIRGQASSVLGVTKSPTVAGLDACLARFGFVVVRSFFAVALPRDRDLRTLARQHGENTEYIRRLTRDPRVSILQGELHRQADNKVEEKQVDVLCAVETVRQAKHISETTSQTAAEAVLVFSQDFDMIPGIKLAQEFGVPVLVVSSGKIHNRKHPFLVLTDSAMGDLTQATGSIGQDLRRQVASAAQSRDIDSWEYRYTMGPRGRNVAMMRHRHGMQGVVDASVVDGYQPGELFDLAPTGVDPGRGNEFPRLLLGQTPIAQQDDDLAVARVVGRFRLFRMTVELNDGKQTQVFAPNSYVTRGTRVLLQATGSRQGDGFRYVGALEDPPPLVGCGGKTRPAISVIGNVDDHRGKNAFASCDDGTTLFIPSGARSTTVGSSHLFSLVGSGRDADAPFVAHVASSELPS